MIYFCLLLLLFCSCSHYYQDAAAQLRDGRFEEAEKKLSRADQHYTESNEAALLLLSRAMVYFQSGQLEKSSHDFEKALDAIDYYKQTSLHEIAGQTLIQDDLAAYVPPPFEECLARFYQALSFLHQGQEDNAAATIYYLENHDAQNPLTTYLLAALFQRRGDISNARVLYSRLKIEPPKGNVLLVHHRGVAPQKNTEIAPISIVSAALVETILEKNDIKPALSTLAGVPIPVLIDKGRPTSILKVNNRSQPPIVSFDIAQAAEDHLDKEMPWTAARAAARLLIRRGLVASTKEKAQPIVDFAMFVSNLATQADTRCWTTLPSCIDLYHLDLKPGLHQVQVGKQTLSITVKEKELTIIELFQPSSDKLFTPKETP
jgi:hypothetical protein